jgi:hypothetical protein
MAVMLYHVNRLFSLFINTLACHSNEVRYLLSNPQLAKFGCFYNVYKD